MSLAPDLRPWFELLVPLMGGPSVIVVLAAMIAWRLRVAVWQRLVWQASTLGIALLLVGELTGVASGVATWTFHRLTTSMQSVAWRGIDSSDAVNAPPRHRQPQVPLAFEFDSPSPLSVTMGADAHASVSGESPGEVGDTPQAETTASFTSISQHRGTPTLLDGASRLPAVLWMMGTVLILGRSLVGRMLLESLRWQNRLVCDAALLERVQFIARRLGMRQRVDVMVAPGLSGPIAFGTLRPTVGLPDRFLEQFDRSQQEAMLAHELGHLAAYDPAWHTLADLLVAVLWWHPLVWWCRHELRSASEWAADEASRVLPDGPEALATCLVEVGGRLLRRRPIGWAGIEGNGFRSSLGRRVERLLGMADQSWRQPQRASSNLVKVVGPAVMVAVALVSTGWSRPIELSEGESMIQSIRQSWRQSLVAMTLAGAFSFGGDPQTLLALDDSADKESVEKPDPKRKTKESREVDEASTEEARAKAKLAAVDAEIAELRAAKRFEEAEKLQRAVSEAREQLNQKHEKKTDKRPAKENQSDKKVAKEREERDDKQSESLDELRARLRQLEAENAKLRDAFRQKEKQSSDLVKKEPDGKGDDKLPLKKPGKLIDGQPPKGGEKQADEQHQIIVKLKQIQDQAAHLQKEGRKEEAEKMIHAAQELQRALAERQAKHGKETKPETPAIAERIEHLRLEIEESTRAGQKDRVHALQQELEKTVDYAQQLQKKGFAKPDPKPGPEAPHELAAVIKQLSNEVHRLRAEVEELRSLVKDRGEDRNTKR